ncbi:acyl-CoA thioesterase [Sphingomonas sp.]|jgi:acyl-CoA thioester hydrolase|uniref:acyl-CoA thioesterase n=1 Tax=Sphingomonas sp. TaxID=28214 RepID=UPI002ED815A8
MPRPESWRLDPAAYAHDAVIPTRFQDLDTLGHINNVAMGALFETARVRLNHALGLVRFRGHRWLVAQVKIDYLAEGHHPTDLVIRSAIGEIGTRSWCILAAAFDDGRPIATCDVVMVMERQQDVSSLPAEFRAALERFRVKRR